VRQAIERGGVTSLGVDYQHPDGTRIPIEVNAAVVADETILALCRDITDRRRAEAIVREGDRRMRDLVEASPLPIVALNRAGQVLEWNPAAERRFGYTAAEVTGRYLPLVPPGMDEQYLSYLDEVLRGNAFHGRPARRRRRDGTELDLRISTAPLRGPDGGAIGVVASYEDVSEQRRVQRLKEELQERQLEARSSRASGSWPAASLTTSTTCSPWFRATPTWSGRPIPRSTPRSTRCGR
jgi:PAS domain S-box-containing protein